MSNRKIRNCVSRRTGRCCSRRTSRRYQERKLIAASMPTIGNGHNFRNDVSSRMQGA